MIWMRAFKSKTPKGIFPDGAKKSRGHKSICRKVEQQFKRLRALYPGRYDRSQLKEINFHQGMHPHLRDSMRFLYMKDDVSYEDFFWLQCMKLKMREQKVRC